MADRLALRYPGIVARLSDLVMRLPPRSRLRRALLSGAFARGNRALNRGDLDAAFATLPQDIEWHLIEDIAKLAGVPTVLWGREAVLQLFERILEVVSWSVEIAEMIDLGDGRIVLRCVGHQTGSASGISGDVPFSQVWEIRDGTPRRIHDYSQHREALEAAGLPG